MDILGPDRGKMTIYGSDFQQVNLTPNGGVSPTVKSYYIKDKGIQIFVFYSNSIATQVLNRLFRLICGFKT